MGFFLTQIWLRFMVSYRHTHTQYLFQLLLGDSAVLCMCCAQSLSCVQFFATPWTVASQALLSMRILMQEYWSGLPCPPPGIFPNQGLNPSLLHCRLTVYHLSYQGSPRILEWVAYPFSMGFSWPRNRTEVSCIAGGFFTNWASRGTKPKVRSTRQPSYHAHRLCGSEISIQHVITQLTLGLGVTQKLSVKIFQRLIYTHLALGLGWQKC